MTMFSPILTHLQRAIDACQAACAATLAALGARPDKDLAAAQETLDRVLHAIHQVGPRAEQVPTAGQLVVTLEDGDVVATWQAHPLAARYLLELNGTIAGETQATTLRRPAPAAGLEAVTLVAFELYGSELGHLTVRAAAALPAKKPNTVNPWKPGGMRS